MNILLYLLKLGGKTEILHRVMSINDCAGIFFMQINQLSTAHGTYVLPIGQQTGGWQNNLYELGKEK